MENRKCFYLVEGECEEKLLKALKGQPALINPGIVKKFNVVQNEIPASRLMSFDPGSRVPYVFSRTTFEMYSVGVTPYSFLKQRLKYVASEKPFA